LSKIEVRDSVNDTKKYEDLLNTRRGRSSGGTAGLTDKDLV